MARSQKKSCSSPSLAAVPTQTVPTTKTICVSTRSHSPSSFLKTALRPSTRSSSRLNSSEAAARRVGGARELPAPDGHHVELAERLELQLREGERAHLLARVVARLVAV